MNGIYGLRRFGLIVGVDDGMKNGRINMGRWVGSVVSVGTAVGGAGGGIISGRLSVLPVIVAYSPQSQQFPPPSGLAMTQ